MNNLICPFCHQDISVNNHAWNCQMNPININNNEFQFTFEYFCDAIVKENDKNPKYYHLSWLETAIDNFKNDFDITHVIDVNMTMGEFIKLWCKKEINMMIEV